MKKRFFEMLPAAFIVVYCTRYYFTNQLPDNLDVICFMYYLYWLNDNKY